MAVPSLSLSTGLIGSLVQGRHQLIDLQRQLTTGKISETYGGLDGTARLTVLSMRSEISAIKGYNRTISDAQLRLNVVQQTLGRFSSITALTRTDAFQSPFNLVDGQQTVYQQGARTMFDEMASLLNSRVGERHLFSGRDTQTPAVAGAKVMLEGDGARAGLKQLISERAQADVGASGQGRIALSNPVVNTVRIAEDGAHPFGFKIGAVVSNLTGVTQTGPGGAPTGVDLAFSATLPNDGETVTVTLTLPDGTSETLQFVAVGQTPAKPNEFSIGPDETVTSANFQAVVEAELARLADVSLRAASALKSADEFFAGSTGNPPLRVDGPPFDSATAQIAGTPANTVFYYQGDDDPGVPARQSALAEVEKNVVVGYGTRADEQAVRVSMAALATLSAVSFNSADTNAAARYEALTARVGARLGANPGQQTFANIQGELGNAQRSMESARERHTFSVAFAEQVISDREDISLEEVGVRILTLQTRMQASMETTAILSRLTLTNFI